MSERSTKPHHAKLMRNEEFNKFCHELFLLNAPGKDVHRNSIRPDLGIEYEWIQDNMDQLATEWYENDSSDASSEEEATKPVPRADKSVKFSSTTSTRKSSMKKDPTETVDLTVEPEDRKPSAQERKARTASVPVETVPEYEAEEAEDDENPTPKKGKYDLDEIHTIVGSPAFREFLKQYDVPDPVAEAQARSPSRPAGSVPTVLDPQTARGSRYHPSAEGLMRSLNENDKKTKGVSTRSTTNVRKVRAAAKLCRREATLDLEYMVHSFGRKGMDPTNRDHLIGVARRFYLDQDRRRHDDSDEIVKEVIGMMLLKFFDNPNGFTTVENEFITGPPSSSDDFLPKYDTRHAKGGRNNKKGPK